MVKYKDFLEMEEVFDAYILLIRRGVELPKNLEKMRVFCEMLSKHIPFVRVDFYEVNCKVYFGEITFFPAAGMGRFVPEEWDLKFGEWIDLGE